MIKLQARNIFSSNDFRHTLPCKVSDRFINLLASLLGSCFNKSFNNVHVGFRIKCIKILEHPRVKYLEPKRISYRTGPSFLTHHLPDHMVPFGGFGGHGHQGTTPRAQSHKSSVGKRAVAEASSHGRFIKPQTSQYL